MFLSKLRRLVSLSFVYYIINFGGLLYIYVYAKTCWHARMYIYYIYACVDIYKYIALGFNGTRLSSSRTRKKGTNYKMVVVNGNYFSIWVKRKI